MDSIDEGNRTISIVLERVEGNYGSISVDLRTVDKTAKNLVNYRKLDSRIEFKTGQVKTEMNNKI